MFHVTILAGGGGTRFWPRSRQDRPKQFLSLTGGPALLEATVRRLQGVVPDERLRILTGDRHVAQARELLADLPQAQVIGEPEGRDTAAAVGLAATLVAVDDPDATLLVVPADHVIEPTEAFQGDVQRVQAALAARPEAVVVLGIPPTRPATGYGYIEKGEGGADGVWEVTRFHEKPAEAQARRYLDAGNCLWNAGMFAFSVRALSGLLAEHLPDLHAGLERIRLAPTDQRRSVLEQVQPRLPRVSFDHGVMEHCQHRLVLEASFQWDDVGSWEALERHLPADDQGNTARGAVLSVDAAGNLVEAGDGLVALLGVQDLIVVRTADVTLVARRDQAERVKELLEQLRSRPDGAQYL